MRKKSMQRIMNIFPFLEEELAREEDVLIVDRDLVEARMRWLQSASKASNEEFALKIMRQEPQGEAFHATWATVLKMPQSVIDKVLTLEKTACAKKIDANRAHIKTLYAHYSIAVIPNRAKQNFSFKFPHEFGWEEAGEGNMSVELADSGFPMAATVGRYDDINVPPSAIKAVEEALKEKPIKRAKRK
jgi:hypothetical protein